MVLYHPVVAFQVSERREKRIELGRGFCGRRHKKQPRHNKVEKGQIVFWQQQTVN
jgi:hypothetical protein